MFRYVHILLLVIFCASPVAAHAADPEPHTIKDEIWAAIDDGDYASVEASLANAQMDFLRGGLSGNDMRELFSLFHVNNPDLIRFVDGWLSDHPHSPFAHTAQAWLLHKISWGIRGDGPAREIYPRALAEFREMQFLAWHHALQAYETDKRFLPASDAILGLANPTGGQRRGYDVLREVMETDPNMGTLTRGVGLTHAGWGGGGSWQKAQKICDHYGPMIDGYSTDPVTYCKLYARGNYHRDKDSRAWLIETLMTGDYPDLEHLVLFRFTHSTATRAEAMFARAYLTREGVTNVEYAREFDWNLALKYDFDFISEAHQRRAQTEARAALKRDPYNPELIRTLQSSISRLTRTEESFRSTVVDDPTREERIEYARRMLVASPYNPRNWSDYGRALYPQSPENVLKDEPFNINKIVYSDHAPGYLLGYAFDKWRLLAALERLDTDPESEAWKRLSEERRAQAEKTRQEWLAVRGRVNLDTEIRCPMMRAYRLFQFVCETSRDSECNAGTEQTEMIEIVRDDVNRRRVCTGVMAVDALDLFYSPIHVDLSAPEG